MRQIFLLIFLILTGVVKGQNTIEWDSRYQLQLSDFQSIATQIGQSNNYSIHSGANIGFSFYMTNAEFMFTKNFNSKVNCSFNRNSATLVAPDSVYAADMLNFARFGFDLSELYARKFRKKLFEEKAAFSDASFFRPLFDEIQREFAEEHTIAGTLTDLGRNREKLSELHQKVLEEIDQLSDFCKLCKPPKKKR